ncbi:copper resistance CopC/CopD family protein [Rhodococcoides kyotonense]|uniref:Copper transport protein n=1 Tax=Rhodococcoides kyotonense TaxID=398843 RepID=A0A239LUT4_9NOCA|nr:copper resistance protein CopC [Rhodococcus kyotonensis]SNT33628.1 copper transport protein [Rhodococcus kyotonensis]
MNSGKSRRWLRILVLGWISLALTIGWPAVASAHATLLEALPGEGTVLADSPGEMLLRYDEAVGISSGAVKVLAPDGSRVELGEITTRDEGRVVVAPLPLTLGTGTYTVLWRVLSEDTHSIFGATTFSVGEVSATAASDAASAQESEGVGAARLLDIARGTLFVGLILLLGGLMFVTILWREGRRSHVVHRILVFGWVLAVTATVAGLLLQGPFTAGTPLSTVFDTSLFGPVLGTRFGVVSIVRLALLALTLVLVVRRVRLVRLGIFGAVVAVVPLSLTVSAVGHAGAGELVDLALPADVLHLIAASAWLGGLVMMVVLLRPSETSTLTVLLPNWSRYAAVSILVLVVSGSFTAWRQVRELGALTSTEYGKLLLIKLALVVAMVLLGAGARWWIRHHYPIRSAETVPEYAMVGGNAATGDLEASTPGDHDTGVGRIDIRPLRWRIALESGVSLLVVAITAVLVATTPAKDTYFPVFEQTGPASDGISVVVGVNPARTGVNSMSLVYSEAGATVDPVRVGARWTSESGEYLVPVEAAATSPGHYEVAGVTLPVPGLWQLAVTTQTSDIDATTTLFTVRIR